MLGTVLFAFIDESYTQDRYYVAALVIDVDDIGKLGAAVHATAQYAVGFGVPLGTELHGHRIMSGTDGWEALHRKTRAKGMIYGHAVDGIGQLPARLYVQGVDVARLNARYSYPDPPHLVCLRHVLEDVNTLAAARNEEVIVICDQVTDQEAHERRFGQYQKIGTPGFRPSKLARIEQLMFADSSASPGLQAVDLAVYLYRRRDANAAVDPRAKKLADDLWWKLRPIVAKARRWDP
ncbi:DUF3800 domain-containing protein [Microbacterium sp. NPDC080220]|uniref:DUF3800 domain-containing protein n=1 Tax=Microbacterium sp. NPDC080220 TaxID=3161017 RepID=UPI00343A5EAC